ncbi:NHL repeat-containing protein [Arundinibacter roseus]|uniref:NHL repeat containing protein n=1 Tax=Arundinibacter roseus TaxID=2070510 RepID=A0A4R4K200_9BACT|nr:hypothetical protein [Arundinibacter roseus]TDB60391.1 hypothetical protein EZE20_20880 [Arundinibacter roseus]
MTITSETYTASLNTLPPVVRQITVFKGDPDSPFLAPRGVWLHTNGLIVADTGQNRVFIWNKIPGTEYATADVVLGQLDTTDTGRNSGSGVTSHTLQYPSGVWSDGTRLIVADAWNHRVLIWNSFPTTHGQAADVVLGQPDFEQNQPNVMGIGSIPSAQSLHWPYGVFSDGKSLWIADTGNRRVLFFEEIPTQNFTAASGVIGKPAFNVRDYENHEPIWPYSVRLNEAGSLIIADTQYYRVLLWNRWQDAPLKPADVIIGQPDFDANGMNQFSLIPKQNSLSWTYDAFFYKNGLFVADTGNSRLLWFEKVPTHNAAPADNLIGHLNFATGSENSNSRYGTEHQLYWPFSLSVAGSWMGVADTGNHRIMLYELNDPA